MDGKTGIGSPDAGRDDEPTGEPLERDAAAAGHYRKMYERISALARIGVWECDLATEALTWTDGVYDLFELPRGSHVDRGQVLALYEEDSRREMEARRAKAVAEGGGFVMDIRIRTARGNQRWVRLTVDVEQQDGRPVRIFGTKQDVTEERAAQERMRALQARLIHGSRKSAMGVMAATLAHELNQPLGAIANYAAGARRGAREAGAAGDIVDQGLKAILDNARRASDIIRGLRDAANGSAVARREVALNPLIREAAALAMAGVADPAALSFDLAEDVHLAIDPVQIQQVLINLIRNADEATRSAARREIRISSGREGERMAIWIDDSGPGIAPDLIGTLFETFVSTKSDGMGVGLSISRTIAEAHGGEITAANGEAGGASFRVLLPLVDPDADPVALVEGK